MSLNALNTIKYKISNLLGVSIQYNFKETSSIENKNCKKYYIIENNKVKELKNFIKNRNTFETHFIHNKSFLENDNYTTISNVVISKTFIDSIFSVEYQKEAKSKKYKIKIRINRNIDATNIPKVNKTVSNILVLRNLASYSVPCIIYEDIENI